MFRRRSSPHPPDLRERARALRQAGFSHSEINTELGGDIPQTTLQSWIADIPLTTEQQALIRRRSYPHSLDMRERARELRRAGLTYPEIVAELGYQVAQGTLSGWLSDIELTTEQRARIKEKELEGARKVRGLVAIWNREKKQQRIQAARDEAFPHALRLSQDRQALQLMAAALYMGEGAKGENQFSFCNSDTRVIRTWMALLRRNFEIDEKKLACSLAISVGMDENDLKQYWSEVTNIPLSQFRQSSIKQNPGRKKRDGYKGVCIIHYHSSAIRRYLDALAQGVIGEILEDDSCEI